MPNPSRKTPPKAEDSKKNQGSYNHQKNSGRSLNPKAGAPERFGCGKRNGRNSSTIKKEKNNEKGKIKIVTPEKEIYDKLQKLYEKQGLMSPPSKLKPDEVKLLIEDDDFDKYLEKNKQTDVSCCLDYLYARSFMHNKKEDDRIEAVKMMISDSKIHPRDKHTPLHVLKKVVLPDDGDQNRKDEKSIFMYEYNKRLLYHLEKEGYRRISDVKLYLRTQEYGNCYLIAACIFVCQLARFHGYDEDPIDISRYVRHCYTDKELRTLVIEDGGGNSSEKAKQMLKKMTEKRIQLSICNVENFVQRNKTEHIYKEIKECGPALVTCFKCPKGFGGFKEDTPEYRKSFGLNMAIRQYYKTGSKHSKGKLKKFDEKVEQVYETEVAKKLSKDEQSYSSDEITSTFDEESFTVEDDPEFSQNEKNDEAYHAMVILDARKQRNKHNKNVEYWFLVQNWWPTSQLQEMNAKYLADAGASICYLAVPKISFDFSDVYSKNPAEVAHCRNLDRADTCMYYEDDDGCSPGF